MKPELQATKPHSDDPLDWSNDLLVDPAVPRRVLVVDDSKLQRRLLSTTLEKWGYEVHEADTGQQGLELCLAENFSIIVSDWMMPGLNGPEFCAALRSSNQSEFCYFILLTSKRSSDEIAEGLNAGADDFLTKPVRMGELKARLKAGERIVEMHEQLIEKNTMLNKTVSTLKELYGALDRDLKEAQKLQQSLVRQTDIVLPQGRTSMLLRPSGHIGGDLVGQFQVCENVIGLFSLDVSGHGVSSALMTARLAGYLSGTNPTQNIAIQCDGDQFCARDPADTARHLNELLLEELETEHYFTFVLCVIDLNTGMMQSVQAGHPHPIIQHSDGSSELLGAGGLPIGLVPDVDYQSFHTQLRHGDRLVLYSDGITECSNAEDALLDEDGLIETLANHRGSAGPDLLTELVADLQQFAGRTDFDDDVSALVFDYQRPGL